MTPGMIWFQIFFWLLGTKLAGLWLGGLATVVLSSLLNKANQQREGGPSEQRL